MKRRNLVRSIVSAEKEPSKSRTALSSARNRCSCNTRQAAASTPTRAGSFVLSSGVENRREDGVLCRTPSFLVKKGDLSASSFSRHRAKSPKLAVGESNNFRVSAKKTIPRCLALDFSPMKCDTGQRWLSTLRWNPPCTDSAPTECYTKRRSQPSL